MSDKESRPVFERSLWVHCLFLCQKRVLTGRDDKVNLEEVDKLVLEKSRKITGWEEE